jgi:hypothetical protein
MKWQIKLEDLHLFSIIKLHRNVNFKQLWKVKSKWKEVFYGETVENLKINIFVYLILKSLIIKLWTLEWGIDI